MQRQVQKHRAVKEGAAVSGGTSAAKRTAPSETKALSDELLDEIDELLEDNAQEFVSQYIQKGGQ